MDTPPPTTATVGILMLDTAFPRIRGDIGHPATWPFPVKYRVVRGASAEAVVRARTADDYGEDGIARFIAAGRELLAEGADGITSSCGFLSLLQGQLAEALAAPVAVSALLQVQMVNRILPPGKRAGVITIERASLSRAHLRAAGAPADTPVIGLEGGTFHRAILDDAPQLDIARSRAELLAAGAELLRRHREVGAVVLECTNMPPHAAALRAALGVPVYSIYTFVQWFHAGLQPRGFGDESD